MNQNSRKLGRGVCINTSVNVMQARGQMQGAGYFFLTKQKRIIPRRVTLSTKECPDPMHVKSDSSISVSLSAEQPF